MKNCCKLCGEENCGFVSRNLEYKCDKYNLYCAAVNKACEWLIDKLYGYIEESQKYSGGYYINFNSLLNDFYEAMEE